MIIPQRTTMAGWCMFFVCLWFLIDAIKDYIYVGEYELESLLPNMSEINKFKMIVKKGSESLYKIE